MDAQTKHRKSNDLRKQLEHASAFVLLGFSRHTVAEANDLRNRFRDAGCDYHVYKNSTIRFAIQGTSHEAVTPLLGGVTGLAYHTDDPAAPARILRDFVKDSETVTIKGGIADGQLLDEQGVLRLASMLGPNELKAQFLALLCTPATQMVRVLNAVPQGFLNVLNAKKDQEAA